MTTQTTIKPGDILTLPFWPGDESGVEDYQYEVESIIPYGGVSHAVLIMHRAGVREKTNRGHFRRETRSLDGIQADLAARA